MVRGTGGVASIGPSRVVRSGGAALSSVAALAMGRAHACALVTTPTPGRFTPYCWGQGLAGQLGRGTAGNLPVPEPMLVSAGGAALDDVTDIALSGTATCLLRATGPGGRNEVWCTGARTSGQLGDGASAGTRLVPERVTGLE